MKTLTENEQEEILKLLADSGAVLVEDNAVSPETYTKVDQNNYKIARLVAGLSGIESYHDSIQCVCKQVLKECGGNDHEQNYQGNT